MIPICLIEYNNKFYYKNHYYIELNIIFHILKHSKIIIKTNYSINSILPNKNPFFIVELESDEDAKRLIRRSILIKYKSNFKS